MTRFCLVMLLGLTVLKGHAQTPPPQPTGFAALHRSGQTFLTWTERGDVTGERYRIYRSDQPITVQSLGLATFLFEVAEDSARFYADRYRTNSSGAHAARYFERYVIADGGAELSAGTGLLVWTLDPLDFRGGTGGNGYYAVTTITASGGENLANFGSGNVVGPLAEAVADPMPVDARPAGPVHVMIQYQDLRRWNPTFHAPRQANNWYGLSPWSTAIQYAVQYAYSYVLIEPSVASCGGTAPSSLALSLFLHGWNNNGYAPIANNPGNSCILQLQPLDIGETWWFGFARDHDYRSGALLSAGAVIVNYTEQRVLRMVRDTLRHSTLGPLVDPERVYVAGSSMGATGALALGLRYAGVFAAAYASQPMTDFRSSGTAGGQDWRPDLVPKWGATALDLPIALDAPGGLPPALAKYQGTGVWTWQNLQAQASARIEVEAAPIGITHGVADAVLEWSTQGQPTYGAFDLGRRAWGGRVTAGGHGWQGWGALPPNLADVSGPYRGYSVRRSETVPGLSRVSLNPALPPAQAGDYNFGIEWSATSYPWDGAPIDTPAQWRISLRSVTSANLVVDLTPRRLQQFNVLPLTCYAYENRRVSDNGLVQSGIVLSDGRGLLTLPAMAVSPQGNRVSVVPSPYLVAALPVYAGAEAFLGVAGATPGANQVLFASLTGVGTGTPWTGLGVNLGLDAAFPIGYGTATSPGGLAGWFVFVPAPLSGATVWLQAAESGRTTSVLQVLIY